MPFFLNVIYVSLFLKKEIIITINNHKIENIFNIGTIVQEFIKIVIANHGAVII
jgi:hypothetical protein